MCQKWEVNSMNNSKKFLAVTLATSLVAGSLGVSFNVQAETSAQDATIQLTDAEIAELSGESSVTRTSVHDPSIVKSGDTYYVFGSHMAVSKTEDLQNWTSVTGESTTSTLFGIEESEGVSVVSYEQAFLDNAYTGKVTALVNGEEVEVDFGEHYDIAEWISNNTIQGNMWAPDVIYNPTMGKWCMYQSLNGAKWNSAVVLLTSENIEGPYVYQGPIVFTGFSTTDSTKSFKKTDIELVIGEQEELPEKYQKISDESWGTYWPHAIDPAVFYDDDGNLWMTYGSWSGGIYMLELDEQTGLRDYTVVYEDDFEEKGASVTSDPYFGTKIAGGYYVSGEGPYIEKIEDYYYLFMSYGFYSPEGGYNMRVFRSENPDGPYVDSNGNSAIFNKYIHNYNAIDKYNNYGVKLMGNYQWPSMNKAEIAQGHNSAFVDDDGKAFVVYHTKFNDGTVGHEVRVHQLYVNSQGWLVASPYEYSGETISETGYSVEEIVGTYGMITHAYQINYGDLEYQEPETIVLNADGTVTGAHTGTWSVTKGNKDATLVLDGKNYYGVFTEEIIDGTMIETMGFTFVSEDGLSIWGTKELGDRIAVAQTVTAGVQVPSKAYKSFELPTEGKSDVRIAWSSSNEGVLSATGKVTKPSVDTMVTMSAKIYKGKYFYEKDYQVLVYASEQSADEAVTIAECFKGEGKDLSTGLNAGISIPNPFYKYVTAIDISGGVTIEFDAVSTGEVHALGTILSFMGDKGANGRLYFTPGSYLGYNANGSYFDANMRDYALVTDYIKEKAHVKINIHKAGFTVTVNDEIAYTEEILTTDVGAGTVKNYKNVLEWLQNSADTLYFGYGSWWNAVGYDEANVKISNVAFHVGPVVEDEEVEEKEPTKTSAEYAKDEVVLASNDTLIVEENPFYGVSAEKVQLAYTINFTEGTAQNGWDGIFSFYNSATGGRVSVQTAPYVCYNDADGNWMDINQPGVTGGSNMAVSAIPGKEYKVVLTITEDGIMAVVNGEEVALGLAGSGAGYDDLLALLGECDQLTWGVGLASTAYWNTEICTLTDIRFVAGEEVDLEQPDESESTEEATEEETTEEFTQDDTNDWDGESTESVYEADGYEVIFKLDSYWDGGYNASVKVKNTSDNTIEDWHLAVDTECEIGNIWNATVYKEEETGYIVKNAGWNQDIVAGSSVEFGFSGSGDFTGFPTSYELKGESRQTQEDGYTVEYVLDSDWGNGFSGRITITNNTEKTLEDWSLEFDFNRSITNIWNGSIEMENDNHYIISNAGYNANIAAGQSISFGFNGEAGDKEDSPSNVKLYSYEVLTSEAE